MGSAILYLILYGCVLFAILVAVDGGFAWPESLTFRRKPRTDSNRIIPADVAREAQEVEKSNDPLRVLHVSKNYGSNLAVDDVSFGVARGTICALLGPNGGGKTSTFNIIRGEATPTSGDVMINGVSITRHAGAARARLGVCPQFTAIDSQLTVRQHLQVSSPLFLSMVLFNCPLDLWHAERLTFRGRDYKKYRNSSGSDCAHSICG